MQSSIFLGSKALEHAPMAVGLLTNWTDGRAREEEIIRHFLAWSGHAPCSSTQKKRNSARREIPVAVVEIEEGVVSVSLSPDILSNVTLSQCMRPHIYNVFIFASHS